MKSIKTIFILGEVYISLRDIYDLLVDNQILTGKQANKWLWESKKKLIKNLSKMYSQGETHSSIEPIIPAFNDYFVSRLTTADLIPKKNLDFYRKFETQFGFLYNTGGELYFEETCYYFETSLLENAKILPNRLHATIFPERYRND